VSWVNDERQRAEKDAIRRDARRAELTAVYGRPERYDALAALSLLDRLDVDLSEVLAYRYRDQAAADAWQRSTLTHNGVKSLGTAEIADGSVIGVYDLRKGSLPRT
jgi:hypothetical protein